MLYIILSLLVILVILLLLHLFPTSHAFVWCPIFLLTVVCCFLIFGYYIMGKKGYSLQEIKKMQVVAHRAAASSAPENSIEAVVECIEKGVDIIEVDIRLTADGEPVLFHDDNLSRMTNSSSSVEDCMLVHLQELHLNNSDKTSTPSHIPTLSQLLEVVDGKCRLLLDLKCSDEFAEKMAKAVINDIAAYGAAGWVTAQSFNDKVLSEIHRLGHPFPLEKLFVFKLPLLPLAYDKGFVYFSYSKYDYVESFNFNYRCVSPSLVRDIHEHGKRVKLWTVGRPFDTPVLPVDGVITDCPWEWQVNR